MAIRRYFAREGLYIDPLAKAVLATILNPYATAALLGTVAAVLCLQPDPISKHAARNRLLTTTANVLLYLTAIGSLLSLNDTLNRGYLNNWIEADNKRWDEEIVLVTGGSSGIGASIVQQLLERKPRTTLVIVDFCPLTFKAPKGSRLHYYACDLSNVEALRSVCQQIRTDVGSPTVLINNAGLSRGKTVMEGSYNDVELTFKTNIIAPFLLTKEFLPDMVARNHGHVVGVSSLSAIVSPAGLADYAATKMGIIVLQNTLRQELRFNHNAVKVRVSTAILGFIRTPMFNGKTNQPGFLAPLVHVDTVGQAIVDALLARESRSIWLPGFGRFVACMTIGPDWFLERLRNSTQSLEVDFVGRQKVDEKTGGLHGQQVTNQPTQIVADGDER